MKLKEFGNLCQIEVIPVAIGSLETLTKYFEKWIEKVD